ncbi:MAG TPA: MerR family transcriptional regulator [Chitinophagaceae bacterium]|nr:MerR family transcriptional regulator [Chitinophagaceae bacterium]
MLKLCREMREIIDNLGNKMNKFTIRDIENLCGIKAHTLRAWEQRYQLFVAKRKQSRHRIYDDNDLKELLRISFLYHHGFKVSRLAAMSSEEIAAAVNDSIQRDGNYELYIHKMIEASIGFDKEAFEKQINTAAIRIGMEKTIIHVFFPFLQRLGMLWLTNNVIPAQEHFASHIIRKKIILATDGLEENDPDSPIIIFFSPEGELHEIPLLAANYFFRNNGFITIYMGVDVSWSTLAYYLERKPADFLYAHIITRVDEASIIHYFDKLCTAFPDKKIILSGPASVLIEKEYPNLQILHSVEEMTSLAMQKQPAI